MTFTHICVRLLKVMRERYIHTDCTYTQNYEEGTYTFTGPCKKTGKAYSVTVKGSELFDLNQGLPLQDALRTVSVDDREFVNSGISPEGWGLIFGTDENSVDI